MARAVGDPRHVSLTLNYFGLAALSLGELDEAERACRECLALAAENQDRFQMSLALQSLGRVALLRGDHSESEWLLHESLAIAREISDRWLEAQALGRLGTLASAGNRARQQYRAAMTAAAAPIPIALDELVALAEFELNEYPDAALAVLAYVYQHPLTRPATRTWAEAQFSASRSIIPAERLPMIEATAYSFSREQPAARLVLFS